MAGQIADLFAQLGFRVNRTGLKSFEKDLKSLKTKIDSSQGVTGATNKASAAQSSFYKEITKGYARTKPTLDDHRRNLGRIREAFRQNIITNREYRDSRLRVLQAISRKEKQLHHERMARARREQMAARRPFADGEDPRQMGNHRIISAIHSDVGLGAMVGGFAAAQSVRSFQGFLAMQQGIAAATGSLEQANKEMEYLQQLSNEMGLFMGDLGEDYAKFAASARDTSITIDQQRDIFKGVAAQVKILNLSAADSKRIFRALSQMMSSGQIMAQELKLQMGDQLPGAMRAMARAAHEVGITQDDSIESMNKAMEAGLLLSEKVLPEFSRQLWEAANQGGALEKAMSNTNAAIGRFQTNVWMANRTLNEAGLDSGVRRLINTLSDFILRSDYLWQMLGETFGFFSRMLAAPFELLASIGDRLGWVSEKAEDLGFSMSQVVGALVSMTKFGRRVLIPIGVLAYAMSALSRAMDEGGLGNWTKAILGIGAAAILARKPLGKLVGVVKNLKTGISNLFGGASRAAGATTSPSARVSGTARTSAQKLQERVGRMNAQRAAESTSASSSGLIGKLLKPLGAAAGAYELIDYLKNTNIGQFAQGNGYGSMDRILYPDIGRTGALTNQERERNRQMIVNGDIRFEIEGRDGPQIADEVIKIINEQLIRPASGNDPVTEK